MKAALAEFPDQQVLFPDQQVLFPDQQVLRKFCAVMPGLTGNPSSLPEKMDPRVKPAGDERS
jgi:hypothetical protein